MKALVLTFDKYRVFAQNMIMCYNKLWPNNPFVFRIPYQSEDVRSEYETKFGRQVEMIKSPSGIVDTMFSLSNDLDANEWVYWCMDDRYPIRLDLNKLHTCYTFINDDTLSSSISGLMFNNNPKIWLPTNRFANNEDIKYGNLVFHRRKNYTMIWNHQFLRVKVVRTFFELFPHEMKQAKEMDPIKDMAILPNDHKLYFLEHNIALYGESTNRGIITKNCKSSLIDNKLNIPSNFSVSDQIIIKGDTNMFDNLLALFRFYIKKYINKVIC